MSSQHGGRLTLNATQHSVSASGSVHTTSRTLDDCSPRQGADADHAPPTGDRRRKRAHVRAEEAGHLDQIGTTQERSKQGLRAKGTSGASQRTLPRAPGTRHQTQKPSSSSQTRPKKDLIFALSDGHTFALSLARRLTKTPSETPQTSKREQTLCVHGERLRHWVEHLFNRPELYSESLRYVQTDQSWNRLRCQQKETSYRKKRRNTATPTT